MMKINCHSVFPLNEVASLLLLRFFFVFSFQKFDYTMSWHGFWGVYLVWGLLDFLTVGLQFLPHLGNFQVSVLHIFFPAPPSFWSLSRTQWQECWIFYYISQIPEALLIFFFCLFSLWYSNWVRYWLRYCSVFSFTNSFLCPLLSLVEPIQEAFCSGFYIFQFLNFHLIVLYIFCFCTKTFFICFKHACNCLLKHFMIALLKSVSFQYWRLLIVFSNSGLDYLGSWYYKWFLTVFQTFWVGIMLWFYLYDLF